MIIHEPEVREAGMGIVLGTKSALPGADREDVGPLVITQNFGEVQNADRTPFITGVAYYDFNSNGQYDLGEGLGGVSVTSDGVTVGAITADAGGYAVPVPAKHSYNVTFSAPGIVSQIFHVNLETNNEKIDFVAPYLPPQPVGPNPALTLRPNTYRFAPVGVAIGYQWRLWNRTATTIEGAENGLVGITATVASDSPAIVNKVKAAGNYSFHMMHTQIGLFTQIIALDQSFLVNAGGTLQYSNRLAHAATNEIARTQISADEGKTWTDLDVQAGSGGVGQLTFVPKTLSLDGYAGKVVKIRFAYELQDGSFAYADTGYGWYIDQIGFTGVEALNNPVIADINSGTAFDFAPAAAGNYAVEVRAKLQNRVLGWGPLASISAIPGPAILHISGINLPSPGQVEIQFTLEVGNSTSFTLLSAPTLNTLGTNWTTESAASSKISGNTFHFVVSHPVDEARFYRVIAN